MSDESQQPGQFYVCRVCTNSIPVLEQVGHRIECPRCGHVSVNLNPRSAQLTLIFSLTALIFYFPANLFPFMTIEMYGNRNSATIWGGISSLFDDGAWVIGGIIFLASLLIPFLKLVVLFYLSLTANNNKHSRLKTRLYLIVEAIGRWSMLDIFLLAVLVAIMKLGPWTTVKPEMGALMFTFVVIFTMLASAYFDPQLLWKKHNDSKNEN